MISLLFGILFLVVLFPLEIYFLEVVLKVFLAVVAFKFLRALFQ